MRCASGQKWTTRGALEARGAPSSQPLPREFDFATDYFPCERDSVAAFPAPHRARRPTGAAPSRASTRWLPTAAGLATSRRYGLVWSLTASMDVLYYVLSSCRGAVCNRILSRRFLPDRRRKTFPRLGASPGQVQAGLCRSALGLAGDLLPKTAKRRMIDVQPSLTLPIAPLSLALDKPA